jgi:histidine ammonia-lyase
MSTSDSLSSLEIDGYNLSTEQLTKASRSLITKISISDNTIQQIEKSHSLLIELVNKERVIYGVNTSMGGFVDWLIPIEHAQTLQENLISSVATNVGPYLDDHIVRASILSRINSLARGSSGISVLNFKKLVDIYNAGIIPCVPSKGSLGASGDLGPLAAIALVAIGKWRAKYNGEILSGLEALQAAGIEPMTLGFKEGLSLINGTSVMAAFGAHIVEASISLIKTYDLISALTFEALRVKKKPFDPRVHKMKPHSGQLTTAMNITNLLKDSKMIIDDEAVEKALQCYVNGTPQATKMPIEDAYSIRCTPHIVGPIRDTIKWVRSNIINELNSSNDNPLIIPECGDVFHNGHFHGQYVSMSMDYLSISLTTLSNLSDRRIDRFMDSHHSNGLPPFLCNSTPGLRLGLMGGQFMATSLTAENRSLCTPLSIQSLTSTGDFQDIVSLGLIAARRANEIYNNACYVLAFELLCGVQAAEIRGIDLLSKGTRLVFDEVRKIVPNLTKDTCLTDHLENLSLFIKSGALLKAFEHQIGEIEL